VGISQKFKIQQSLPPLPHSPRSEASRSRVGSRGGNNTIRYDAMTPKATSPPATPAPETPAAVEA
jgi:hypothetical protein